MTLDQWNQLLVDAFRSVWTEVAVFLPKLIVALLVLIIGWAIAVFIGKAVAQLVGSLKLDNALRPLGVEDALNRGGFRLDSGAFIGGLVKWFLVIWALVAASDIFGLSQVTQFLYDVLRYLPNVVVASVVLLVAALVADVIQRVVAGSARAAGMPSAQLAGGIAKWAIWIFGLLVALNELGIAVVFSQTLFIGVVAMLSLAGGLAFGLGGKEVAADYLRKLQKDISHK
ncbi:MAG: hypothetical protein Q8Q18_01225 [bacterium]|nr:hypothetical protein [bacterium]